MSDTFLEMVKESFGADKVTIVGGEGGEAAEGGTGEGGTGEGGTGEGGTGEGGTGEGGTGEGGTGEGGTGEGDPISFSTKDFGDWGFGDELKTKEDWSGKLKGAREELSTLRESSKKYNKDIFDKSNTELSALKKQNKDLMGAIDPLSHFSSPESYKREQLLKKFPGKNPTAISRIMGEDIDKMDTLGLLRLHAQFKYGWSDGQKINDLIEEDFNVDLTDDDFTPSARMEARAIDAKEELTGIKNTEVDTPVDYKTQMETQIKDFEKKVEASKKAWEPIVKTAVSKLDKLTLNLQDQEGKTFSYDFELDPEQLKGVDEVLLQQLSSNGGEVTEESLKDVMMGLRKELLIVNLPAIFRASTGTALAELDERWSIETNNPRLLNTTTKPNLEKTPGQLSKEQAEQTILES